MIRKMCFTALLIAVVVATGYAAGNDNAAPHPAGTAGKPSGAPSFFEGTWAGSWQGFYTPSTSLGCSLTISKRSGGDGFDVEYSWETLVVRNRTIPAGSLKTRGRQEGDRFFIKYKNQQGAEQQITLQKESENKVKARLDRGGTLAPSEPSYYDGYMNRR